MKNRFAQQLALALAGIMLLAALRLAVVGQVSGNLAIIAGFVRDAQGAAVAGTLVLLQTNGTIIQTTATDSHGNYRFDTVTPGTYTVRVKLSGVDGTASGSFLIARGETKNVDLTLKAIPQAHQDSKPPAMPEFSDQPEFTVAGVADTTNLGGHGSDVVVRNREGLARATASLGNESAANESAAPAQPPASLAATERSMRAAADADPTDYEANYRLGKLLVGEAKAREAIPYLERASQIKSGAYETGYELALAHCVAGDYEIAAKETRTLLARQDAAELHHLLGEIEEKRNNPLEALKQYQRAAELDPSESNYFDWGAELLLHQAPEPAIEVFSKGSHLFPGSVRMLTALGAAWYARGSYERAVDVLCRASDLDPNSSLPYMFLGRIQNVEATENPEVVTRLARFARLQPENAWADFYYAVSLWKQRKAPEDIKDIPQIESLLQTAIRIDPKLGPAYLQLGALYSEQKNPASIAAYQKAVENEPDVPDAHYRLARAYREAGEKLKAEQELQLYRETSNQAAKEAERERHEVRQFVFTMRNQTSVSGPK